MTVVVVVVVLALVVAAAVVLAKRGAARARQRVDDRLAGLEVLRRSKANLYGVGSKGATQARGLGVLALTPDELLFVQFVPDHLVRVRRRDVKGVTTSRSFLGKTQGRDLLVVTWETDVAAWDVPDIAGWQTALRRTTGVGQSDAAS